MHTLHLFVCRTTVRKISVGTAVVVSILRNCRRKFRYNEKSKERAVVNSELEMVSKANKELQDLFTNEIKLFWFVVYPRPFAIEDLSSRPTSSPHPTLSPHSTSSPHLSRPRCSVIARDRHCPAHTGCSRWLNLTKVRKPSSLHS